LARKSLPARVGDKTRPDKKKESGGSTRATIREVAKRASVSLTTVSRVINNAVAVRPAVRARVSQAMDELAFGRSPAGATLALNARHLQCIAEARAALDRIREAANPAEITALELRDALDALGRVLGQVTPDEVLGRIFSTFCIGK